MKTGIFVGRFQPFHDGHKRCIEKILEDCDKCIVLSRDTDRSDKNPFEFEKCKAMIRVAFPDESKVQIMRVDDPDSKLSVYIGRDVGYELIQLDDKTEKISATDLRKELYANAGKEYKENPHPLEQ
ncbi:adenylyltransferase/cytidyltransferase family protein [Patescibacteria group bacterium]|nr:adenylyltransferase/cytidyltransferase family protein [Patescibacteria group bacterium]MBU1123653.1 adenylyltransferase/cytidyltransferase family protein [Patescibacteria group bacterium]MBU1911412.1 adenylyltransferase/cytidyltransferase family protein [Patescibacteria group bacterium]